MPRSLPALALIAALLAAGAVPALAANTPNAADLSTQQDARSIALQNWSSHDITQAHVQTTDGRVWKLAKGGISRNEAAQIIVPARDCIANISVEMKDGGTLQAVGLHACSNTEIVVRDNQITIPQQAIPGAKQHGTPG